MRAAVVGTVYQKAVRARTTVGSPKETITDDNAVEEIAERERKIRDELEASLIHRFEIFLFIEGFVM